MPAGRGRPHNARRSRAANARHNTPTSQRLRTNSVPIRAHPADRGRSRRNVAQVRATSPPIALTVAAAALTAAALMPLAVPSSASAERWLRPVPGEVARPYDYSRAAPFERGAHRGVDLAAAAGTPVRSACSGTVVHAGPVVRAGRVVSVRCGARRVSYLPLARVTVRARAPIRAGAPIGTVAAGHGGLHLGVRREAERFAYEDPLALLTPRRTGPRAPVVARRTRPPRPQLRPRAAPRIRAPRPARVPHVVSAPPASSPATVPRAPTAAPSLPPAGPPRAPRGAAPWPVWAGLGLVLAGAAGSGTVVVRRRRAARPPAMAAKTLRGAA
jgi:Peptidase family M23